MHGPDHVHHLQHRTEHGWDGHQGQTYRYESREYVYSSTGTAVSNGTSSDSVEEDYEQEAYLHTGQHAAADGQDHCFQVVKWFLDTLCYYIRIRYDVLNQYESFLWVTFL